MSAAIQHRTAHGVLEERRSSPGLLLALLGHVAMRQLREAHLARHLSPRQFHLLGLLHDHGPMPQSELGLTLDIDASILVTMLNPLEADGFIARERDPRDRRRHLVTLTPAGEQHLAYAAEGQREAEDALLVGLDDSERHQLQALLLAVQDGLGQAAGRAARGPDTCQSPEETPHG